jgi:predicted GNAT family acetyltransferase
MRDTQTMDADAVPTLTRRDDRGRYELAVGGEVVAFAEFSQRNALVTIPYIETAVPQRGKGYSSMLMDGVIDDLRAREVRVRATCSVARAHITRHAADLLVE